MPNCLDIAGNWNEIRGQKLSHHPTVSQIQTSYLNGIATSFLSLLLRHLDNLIFWPSIKFYI